MCFLFPLSFHVCGDKSALTHAGHDKKSQRLQKTRQLALTQKNVLFCQSRGRPRMSFCICALHAGYKPQ